MDGVIVDSMPYHFIAWYEALREFGIRINCFDVYAKEGEKWGKTVRYFLKRQGIKPSKELLGKIFLARQRIFKNVFKCYIFEGINELLRCLDNKGYKLAMVTGTSFKTASQILPKKIFSIFDCVIAGDDVKKGKPHPEPYLKAAKILKMKPSECVVVENAPFGVESAKKAGMFCIAITTSLPKEYLRRADIITDKLGEVSAIIDPFCGAKGAA